MYTFDSFRYAPLLARKLRDLLAASRAGLYIYFHLFYPCRKLREIALLLAHLITFLALRSWTNHVDDTHRDLFLCDRHTCVGWRLMIEPRGSPVTVALALGCQTRCDSGDGVKFGEMTGT